MADHLKPGNPVAAIDQVARNQLGEFYATAAMYGLGNGIGLDLWEAPFITEDDRKQAGWQTAILELQDRMTLSLRVVFETDGQLIAHGDTFEITANGAASLTAPNS
jgi:Xaa-Pro aminopeptidase